MGDDQADQVLRDIRRIVRKVSEHSRELARDVGLTLPQLLCLKAIGASTDGMSVTVKWVAQDVQLSPTTVSRIIDRLVNAGLVSRERSASDRRRVCLSLTLSGIDRYQTLPKPLQVHFIERFTAKPEAERRALLDALATIVYLMEAGDVEAAPVLAVGTIPTPLD